jgi:hypothetical protein
VPGAGSPQGILSEGKISGSWRLAAGGWQQKCAKRAVIWHSASAFRYQHPACSPQHSAISIQSIPYTLVILSGAKDLLFPGTSKNVSGTER